jgi:tRNA(Ile)-lysidine synthase
MELVNRFKDVIDRYKIIKKNDKLLVCVSTGSDSMCLLDLLLKLQKDFNIEINVAHVNHGLREESKTEESYIVDYCKENNIRLFIANENVKELSIYYKKGIEETARLVRYNFFNKVLFENNLDKIVVAHNSNDNIETILLNIIRGCGIKGLNGMDYINNNIVRPLIDFDKKEIVDYCKNNNIKYFEDKTNMDNTYTRNKIRNQLIPLLKSEYNSNIEKNILRLSKLSKLDEDFIDSYVLEIVNNNIQEINNDYIVYNFKSLEKEMQSIKYRSIRKLIERVIGNLEGIENIHIEDILKLINSNIKNKKFIIGNKFTIILISKYILKIERIKHG